MGWSFYITEITAQLSDIVWGIWTIIFLCAVGLLLTWKTRFVQITNFRTALKLISGGALKRDSSSKDTGDISPFQAFTTALSATIGNGNVAGVATAIAIGGPGAAFWMCTVSLFGMATKYSEAVLGIKYRQKSDDGTMLGGPMVYLNKGLGMRRLSLFFAIAALFGGLGAGNMTQSNSIALVLFSDFGIPKWFSGMILALTLWFVIIGGIKRIGRVAEMLVPGMALIYIISCLAILVVNLKEIPEAIILIIDSAFNGTAATGGFAGATVARAMAYGFRRGTISSEAGVGTAAIAHGAARTSDPHRQGIIAMMGVFMDTMVISTMTALVLVTTGAWSSGLISTEMTAMAFKSVLPFGGIIIIIVSALFGFTTMVGWAYYCEQSLRYIGGIRFSIPFRWIYCGLAGVGAIFQVKPLWDWADIFMGFMVFANLIALVALRNEVKKMSQS
ncbi:MAG TPA: sodium:alanine symporter family protein [Candidatus Marinimicrobia bacterium]|nr:sodium:alanine symporter family protein [Candidatus Neomarinimicrobiota bacterium]